MKTDDVHGIQNLYMKAAHRKRTDTFCTIVAVVLALFMFIASLLMWNKKNFQKHFSFRDGVDIQEMCNMKEGSVHYVDLKNIDQIKCVEVCPQGFVSYKNICIPTQNNQRQQFFSNTQIALGLFAEEFQVLIIYVLIISISLGLLRLGIVNLMPRSSVAFDFYMSIITLIGIGVLLIVLYDKFWRSVTTLKIIVIVLCFLITFFIFVTLCMYRNQLKVYQIFVDYAVQVLKSQLTIYIYIPMFLLFSAALLALILWQHFSFVSRAGRSKIFYNLNNSGVWGILNIFQLIWGMQFLRDAFNFCVSGSVVNWYWSHLRSKQQVSFIAPFFRFLCKNFGSVVAGSFFNAFFQIPNNIFSILRCHPNACFPSAGRFCNKNCSCFTKVFDLVRTDPYSYINITGHSFCESAIECRKNCESSQMFVGVHSPMKNYRLICHLLCISLLCVASWFFMRYQMVYYGIWNYIIVIIIILLSITWFISIITDAAQALQTCYLCECQYQSDYQKLSVDQPFRSDLQHRQLRVRKDGHC